MIEKIFQTFGFDIVQNETFKSIKWQDFAQRRKCKIIHRCIGYTKHADSMQVAFNNVCFVSFPGWFGQWRKIDLNWKMGMNQKVTESCIQIVKRLVNVKVMEKVKDFIEDFIRKIFERCDRPLRRTSTKNRSYGFGKRQSSTHSYKSYVVARKYKRYENE